MCDIIRILFASECLVEYNYLAEEEDELTLTKGDRITEVVTMHDGWWEGTLNGKRGLFPDNFVKVITPNSGVSPGSIVEGPSKSWSGGDAPKMREKPGSGPHPRYELHRPGFLCIYLFGCS